MTTTVIGTIDDKKIAQKLISELVKTGFKDQDIEILDGPESKIVAAVVERGFEEDDARGYAKAARGGKTLVVARTPDQKVEEVMSLMERYEAAEDEAAEERGDAVQEVEEDLKVGKRRTATGGVRVTTNVTERPVEKTVTLREEHVEVDRKAADRRLSPDEAEAAFAEKAVDLLTTSEEAEVSKEARVVGEVSIGKRVEEREQTVRDKVRRTEVEVEEIGGKTRKAR